MPDSTCRARSLAIVTVTFNSSEVIGPFLDSALAQSLGDFSLYVIDNASADDTLAQIAARGDPRILVTANPTNRGVAAGNNQGIEAARAAGCTVVGLLNNDTLFGPDLFASLVAALDGLQCDMVAPKILFDSDRQRIWCAGGTFRPWAGYSVRSSGFGVCDRGQFDQPRRISYAPTCCLFIKSDVFRRVGLMDERYFVYGDDADFCLRAHRRGVVAGYWPHATLLHKANALTGGDRSPFSMRYLTRNRVYFIRRHLSRWGVPFWLGAYQLLLLARCLRGRDRWADWGLRQRAFFEGCGLPVASTASSKP